VVPPSLSRGRKDIVRKRLVGIVNLRVQRGDRSLRDHIDRLLDRRQRRLGPLGRLDPVEADHGQVVRHAQPERGGLLERADRPRRRWTSSDSDAPLTNTSLAPRSISCS
jgi:hypothetical protein